MEQTTTTTTTTTIEVPKRPVFLTVLCVLSFIAAGFGVIGYVGALTLMTAASAISSEASAAIDEAMSHPSGPSAGLTWAYIIVGFLTTLVSLFGVIKMWKLQKIGYFIYTGAAVASMVMGVIYSGFGAMGVVFPVLFIVLYGLNLKHLK